MKRILHALLSLLMLAPVAMAVTIDEIPNVHVANRSRYVSNPDGVLSASAVAELDRIIAGIWEKTSCEVVAVAVDELDGSTTAHDAAYQLLQKWGVGKKDKNNGVVILLDKGGRRVEIVTGRGVEGVLPDIICGRITGDVMRPLMARGDLDGGMIAGVSEVARVLENPEYAAELKSRYANDRRTAADDGGGGEELWRFYKMMALIVFVGMFIYAVRLFRSTRHLELSLRYEKLKSGGIVMAIGSFVTLGLGLFVALGYWVAMRRLRTRPRRCPNCGTKMKRLGEEEDNEYLTPAQDLEEKLNSVDYDVWVCPGCNEVDIIPFVNRSSGYTECPRCHARALAQVANRIIQQPTTRAEGVGERVWQCRSCGYDHRDRYRIARRDDGAGLAAAAILGAAMGGRGGSGGGFSGGSFGGGSSAGGGAGASW